MYIISVKVPNKECRIDQKDSDEKKNASTLAQTISICQDFGNICIGTIWAYLIILDKLS